MRRGAAGGVVLVVDDDATIRAVVAEALRDAGYRVATAATHRRGGRGAAPRARRAGAGRRAAAGRGRAGGRPLGGGGAGQGAGRGRAGGDRHRLRRGRLRRLRRARLRRAAAEAVRPGRAAGDGPAPPPAARDRPAGVSPPASNGAHARQTAPARRRRSAAAREAVADGDGPMADGADDRDDGLVDAVRHPTPPPLGRVVSPAHGPHRPPRHRAPPGAADLRSKGGARGVTMRLYGPRARDGEAPGASGWASLRWS